MFEDGILQSLLLWYFTGAIGMFRQSKEILNQSFKETKYANYSFRKRLPPDDFY